MQNPIRNLIQLHLGGLESIMSSFIAAEGKPENIPTAMMMFLIERAEDPIVVLNILLGMGMPKEGQFLG